MCGIAGLLDPAGARGMVSSATWLGDGGRARPPWAGRLRPLGGPVRRRRAGPSSPRGGGQGLPGPPAHALGQRNWVLNYNGELYNTAELRSALAASGVRRRRHIGHRGAGRGARPLGAHRDARARGGHVRLRRLGRLAPRNSTSSATVSARSRCSTAGSVRGSPSPRSSRRSTPCQASSPASTALPWAPVPPASVASRRRSASTRDSPSCDPGSLVTVSAPELAPARCPSPAPVLVGRARPSTTAWRAGAAVGRP